MTTKRQNNLVIFSKGCPCSVEISLRQLYLRAYLAFQEYRAQQSSTHIRTPQRSVWRHKSSLHYLLSSRQEAHQPDHPRQPGKRRSWVLHPPGGDLHGPREKPGGWIIDFADFKRLHYWLLLRAQGLLLPAVPVKGQQRRSHSFYLWVPTAKICKSDGHVQECSSLRDLIHQKHDPDGQLNEGQKDIAESELRKSSRTIQVAFASREGRGHPQLGTLRH